MKSFSGEETLIGFITSKPTLNELLWKYFILAFKELRPILHNVFSKKIEEEEYFSIHFTKLVLS